jgi:inosine-uridine nucleoside N-ribohydrolase
MLARLILDTDIGTDVDDCLALALILGSPELALEGVTCVYGDVALRARMALKLLALAGRAEIPVMLGARETLFGGREVYWAGHEGEGLLEPGDDALQPSSEDAVDFIVRVVMANPGVIHLLAIGPLTNVALALQREPGLFDNLAGLTIMGGALRSAGNLSLRYAEHNVLCDPVAAKIVIEHPRRKTLVPLDVTTQVSIRQEDVKRIHAAGTPFHDAVAGQVERYPYFARVGSTHLHDPLAAALLIDPRLCDVVPLHVDVETEGEYGAGVTFMRTPDDGNPANADVALGVDPGKAERFIVERVASAPPPSF